MLPEKVLSALITALAVVFFSLTVYALTKSQSVTIVSSLLLAFGTSAWSTASLALWQHGPSMLMLSIALYLLVQVRHKPQVVPYIAIPLAFSFIIRPTNSISILFFSVHIFLEYRNYFLRYCLWGASIGLLFFVFNYSIYESFLPAYYLPSRLVSQSHFLEALLGNLISPGRGLFIFSPFLILAIYGLYLKYRNKNINILDIILASIIVFHWLVISSFPHWWAGHSIGPRFWTDILLYVLFFIIPVISKNIYNPLLVSLAVISIIWHFHSVSDPVVFDWNSVPNNIDMFPARVWDWRDAPLLRGSRWSLMIY